MKSHLTFVVNETTAIDNYMLLILLSSLLLCFRTISYVDVWATWLQSRWNQDTNFTIFHVKAHRWNLQEGGTPHFSDSMFKLCWRLQLLGLMQDAVIGILVRLVWLCISQPSLSLRFRCTFYARKPRETGCWSLWYSFDGNPNRSISCSLSSTASYATADESVY